MQKVKLEQVIKALNSIVYYNGLEEVLNKIKNDIEKCRDSYYVCMNMELFTNEQFEIFWMLMVLLFGDYGTSPRSGWLYMDNKNEITEFIDKLIEGHKEVGE